MSVGSDSITAMTDLDDLLQRIATRAASDNKDLPEPVDDARIAEAERQLGFTLHPCSRACIARSLTVASALTIGCCHCLVRAPASSANT